MTFLRTINIDEPTGAFGELSTAEVSPSVQIDAVYGLLNDQVETFTATGGSAAASDGLFKVGSGTSVGGYGVIRSKRASVYRPGQGMIGRFTALWPTVPGASMTAWAGLFNLLDAFAFGYNGANFGILHRTGGRAEIQTLTITASATGSENVTVTLNGSATVVAITASTAADTAQEIAENDTWDGWNVQAVGSTVVFMSTSVEVMAGAFTFSSDGTATGSFAQDEAGVAHTNDWTAESSWNGNALPFTLDPSKGNVFEVAYQYLGFGIVEFKIEDPSTGKMITVHRLEFPNSSATPHTRVPSMKVGWIAASLGGSGTNIECYGASALAGVTGKSIVTENSKAKEQTNTSVGTSFETIMQFRNRNVFGNTPNLGIVFPQLLSVSSSSTKNTTVQIGKLGVP
jgi:hypothetical protein